MTCETWQCSQCEHQRPYGGVTHFDFHLHLEGAPLNCEKCKKVTKHIFTGKYQETRNVYGWKQQFVN